MRRFRVLRLPAVIALCGAGLRGWSVSSVASVDRALQAQAAPAPTAAHDARLILDHRRHGHHREL